MKLDTFHIVEIENNFKPDIIDERHKYHNDDNTNLTESGKVNTTNFEVYFKLNDYKQYLNDSMEPDFYDYQKDYKLFVCPSHSCYNITDLHEIEKPYEISDPM